MMGFSREQIQRWQQNARMARGETLPTIKEPSHRSKYNVSRKDERTFDGILFASKAEMHRYTELLNMQKAGAVKFFLRQVSFHLPGNTRYVLDFLVFYADGRVEFEDVKGCRTQMYALKRKQVEALYPIKIREVKR